MHCLYLLRKTVNCAVQNVMWYFFGIVTGVDMTPHSAPVEPFVLVIFGGTGDLAMRKLLPALLHRFNCFAASLQ